MGTRRYLATLSRTVSLVALVACPLVVPSTSTAQTPAIPTLTTTVNDLANVIDASASAELDRLIRTLQAASGDVIVVATVPNITPYGSIEEYAVRMFEQSGIGTRASDNGLLVLVAVEDRKVRIEVGYGLEEFITDGYAGDVIRTHLLPAFREERYGPGLVAATSVIALRIADRRGVTLADVQAPAQRTRDVPGGARVGGITTLLIGLAIFVIISRLSRGSGNGPSNFNRHYGRRGGRSTWSGWHGGIGGFGGGGGGFGGFGGGRSGGGGASGGW